VKAGDIVDIELEKDLEPRVLEVPPDFQSALDTNPAARIRWQKLSFTHQREYVESIEDAKKPETRIRRIQAAIDAITGKHK
jgi:uncharacterized protein YdeI (YjbR/CyaY-like superfamily)